MWALIAGLILIAPAAGAEVLVAARTLPPGTVVTAADVALADLTLAGALRDPSEALGLETRIAIYAGRPVRAADLAQPAVVERNQRVLLLYRQGGLTIRTEGRALDRAAVGAVIRVMNVASRTTISGQVLPDGSVQVGIGSAG